VINKKIKILDSTLREGIQSIYAEDIKDMKSEYISQTNKLGIFDFGYNNVLFSDSEFDGFLLIKKRFSSSKFFMHFYLNEKMSPKFIYPRDYTY